MPTNWVVTTAAERIALNEAKQGETTFTVTNPGTRADRVVFEPVPGQGADPSWFTVDEPQRRVQPAASVSFLVKAQVPPTMRFVFHGDQPFNRDTQSGVRTNGPLQPCSKMTAGKGPDPAGKLRTPGSGSAGMRGGRTMIGRAN